MQYYRVNKGKSEYVLTCPHSGRRLLDNSLAPEPGDRGTDYLAGILSEKLDASSIIPSYSRMVVDFNKPKERCISSSFHKYRIPEPSEKEKEKIKIAYDSYDHALKSLITLNTIHIALHAMYFKGPEGSCEEGKLRPDFRLGTRDGGSYPPEKTKSFASCLDKKGYSAEVDNVFKGGDEIRRSSAYGAESLQIEINSNLLLKDDDDPYEEKHYDPEKIDALAKVLYSCIISKDSRY